MIQQLQHISRQYFNADSFTGVTLNQLREMVQRYPFSPVLRILCAKKAELANEQDFDRLLADAALYAPNPLWLNWMVHNHEVADTKKEAAVPESAATEAITPTNAAIIEDTAKPSDEMINEPATTMPEALITEEKEIPAEHSASVETPQDAAAPEPATPQPQPANPENEPVLTFEPFHTVDYFASQGIKLDPDDKPKDKFGQQLKSFTEWLKSMKKLPAPQQPVDDEIPEDKGVHAIAATSIAENEVLTEAMAEVLFMQGKTGKAIDLYRKLSLLNPDKSHYFAAKIEAIKVT
jgi:hypothetical protein